MHTHPRNQHPLIFDALLVIALFATILLSTQARAGATEIAAAPLSASVAGPPADAQLTTGDLGVAERFVTDATVITGLDGVARTGVEGLQTHVASLEAQYPDAQFETARTQTVNSMIIIDWNATVDGTLVLPGRTLVTIGDGAIAEIHFLNLNNVAPVQGQMAPIPTTSVYTHDELPYEQGRPVVVEQDDATMAAQDAPKAAGRYVIVDEMGNVFTPEQASLTVTGAAPERFATDADQD